MGFVMTEVLFLITTLFVAYVVYVIVNEKKGGNAKNKSMPAAKQPEAVMPQKAKPVNTSPAKSEPAAVKAAPAKPAPVKAAPKPAPAKKVSAPKPPAAKAAPAAAPEAIKSKGLKDPKTGEVVSTYSNYRFTKRWIKEALVAEGLVDKIYKNDELNPAIEANIKSAIGKLENIKKYQP